jgi:hypothetical protein
MSSYWGQSYRIGDNDGTQRFTFRHTQWVKKVFARKNGASKGATDRYWYSPKQKFKLRSMVQVRKFLKALAETKGDEKRAKEMMVNY